LYTGKEGGGEQVKPLPVASTYYHLHMPFTKLSVSRLTGEQKHTRGLEREEGRRKDWQWVEQL
jgi:hypothetical protein